jgi:tetratricopeptide (TPR) repeat protein
MSPSRFTRATAIGTLDEIVLGDDGELASRALVLAAEWADDVGDALTPLELDRLVALFGRERAVQVAPRAKDVMRALARIIHAAKDDELDAALDHAAGLDALSGVDEPRTICALNARARDILGGRFEVMWHGSEAAPEDPARRRALRHEQILDVAVAMRDRAPTRAARSLRKLLDAERAGERLPRPILAVAHAALVYDDAELRDVAARFFEARLKRVRPGAPPRGWLALADALATCGEEEVAVMARRAAAFAKEPGAAESLGASLARSGWEYARSGDRTRALEKLREAKALFESVAR